MQLPLRGIAALTVLSFLAPLQAAAYSITDFPSAQHVSRRLLTPTAIRQTPATQAVASCSNMTWKKATITGTVIGEVPSTWSTSFAGDVGLATNFDDFLHHILYSVAENGVAYGDINWSQIDLAAMAGKNVQAFEAWYKKTSEAGDQWSTVTIGGHAADVLTFPLDNGQTTKLGTGGKVFFIRWAAKRMVSGASKSVDMGLIVWKQAKADVAFECGAQHFLNSLTLDDYTNAFQVNYPTLP